MYIMLKIIEITKNDIPSNAKHLPAIESVRRVNHKLTYNEFFHTFLIDNEPCIIDTVITESWPCRQQWVLKDAPNFELLGRLFGQCLVPISDCKRRYYNSQLKNDMNMQEYLDYWIKYRNNDYTNDMPLLYLKDWHCAKIFPDLIYYEVPHYFASDWLNEYYIAKPELEDDYMFVYMGPKGTWTPLHADVFFSYSWSANIVGRKRWLLFPPKEENKFRDSYGQLVYDVLSEDLKDHSKYKEYDSQNIKCFDVIQEAGEIMFIPSGWHHQVWNLEDTISVNHNWINGCNIYTIWLSLKQQLSSVMKEVEDCKDMVNWVEHCQLMLKVSHGMNYIQFYSFISFIATKRLDFITKGIRVNSFRKYEFGINHCSFDLTMLKTVLEDFIIETKEKSIYSLISADDQPINLLEKINSVLRDEDK
ncbi:2-oxoglutarate and iron-dependent oxygenase JMJD4-like isoform X1 [Vespa mandarinia]|uniref:2-oxoglutarate and iron-dependent oxygenase JMJD4-like isoform X1 n=1 Tax=Vespa mandarinia TaxID=7446 RepID=UPI00160B260C|nr:2-oxoglutarate and iron-dependent oxygenase JMJD4-like isoform X1 [Vespa mandarinia]